MAYVSDGRMLVVDGNRDGGEQVVLGRPENCAGKFERSSRLEAGFHIRPQRVSHSDGMGQRGATVPRDIAEDDRDASSIKRESVVEVTARGRTIGGLVGGRGLEITNSGRNRRNQCGLHRVEVGD